MKLLLLVLLMSGPGPDKTEAHIDSLFTVSKAYWYNNRDSASYFLKEVLRLSRTSGYRKGEANALKGLGQMSYSLAQSLELYLQALQIRQEIRDSVGIGVSYADIAYIYSFLGDPVKQLEYLQRSYTIRKKIGDNGGIAQMLISLGQLDKLGGRVSEALVQFKQALSYRLKENSVNGIAYAHINIAEAYFSLRKYDSSRYFATLADQEFKKAKNTSALSWTGWILANVSHVTGNTDSAMVIIDRVLKIPAKGLETSQLMRMLLLASDIQKSKHNYPLALKYQDTWIDLTVKQQQTSTERLTRQIAADFEFKVATEELRRHDEDVTRRKRRQDNLQFLVIAVLLMIAFVSIILFRKVAAPRVLDVAIFLAFIFLFEFLIVLLDPFIQTISGNRPVVTLLANAAIALALSPLHTILDKVFKNFVKSREASDGRVF